jgi:hypothetical protein
MVILPGLELFCGLPAEGIIRQCQEFWNFQWSGTPAGYRGRRPRGGGINTFPPYCQHGQKCHPAVGGAVGAAPPLPKGVYPLDFCSSFREIVNW